MSDAMALEPSGAKRNANPNLKDGGLVLEKAAHAHAHAHASKYIWTYMRAALAYQPPVSVN